MTEAILRFTVPDLSVTKDDRGLFSLAAPKEVVDEKLILNDARQDTRIVKGAGGLDVQGFAYIQHRSALADSDQYFSGQNIEDIYLPEVRDLICKVTGAKSAIVNNCAFRYKLVDEGRDPKFYLKKGNPIDVEIAKMPRNVSIIYGKGGEQPMEPARPIHVDCTAKGLRSTMRECRQDISAMAQHIIDAEDARARGEDVVVPRYAAYSVWRAIKPVKHDPLVVCDYRSLDKDDLVSADYRALSEQNSDNEYTVEYWNVAPPKDPKQPQWYWMPEQKPDEVLIIKFADTAAEIDPSIARCCPHGAAVIPGTAEEEPRFSIEARVIAFW